MKLIEWINGVTKLSKKTMDEFQNNVSDAINNIPSGMPVGAGCDFYGITPPEGYMFADGSEISRTDYAELFGIIGETYGAGDGSTTFNLPDKRKRVSVMKGDNDTLGAKVGNDSITLAESNLPQITGTFTLSNQLLRSGYGDGIQNTSGKFSSSNSSKIVNYLGEDKHSSSSGNQNLNDTVTLSFGSDNPTAIDNRQSSLVCNYIIKVK